MSESVVEVSRGLLYTTPDIVITLCASVCPRHLDTTSHCDEYRHAVHQCNTGHPILHHHIMLRCAYMRFTHRAPSMVCGSVLHTTTPPYVSVCPTTWCTCGGCPFPKTTTQQTTLYQTTRIQPTTHTPTPINHHQPTHQPAINTYTSTTHHTHATPQ